MTAIRWQQVAARLKQSGIRNDRLVVASKSYDEIGSENDGIFVRQVVEYLLAA